MADEVKARFAHTEFASWFRDAKLLAENDKLESRIEFYFRYFV